MTWLVSTRLRCSRMVRLQKLEAAVVARIEPSVQSRWLSCMRVIKRELALAGWLQPVRRNGQDRGDQPCPFAVEDVNDIPAGRGILQLHHVLPACQYPPFHPHGLLYPN